MDTDNLKIPGADDRDHSGDIAGLEAQWLGEAATLNPDTVKHRAIELKANKLGILCRGSREYFRDAIRSEAFIRDVMTKAANFYLNRAFVRGTGTGQPLGVMNCPNLISINKEAGQDAQTFLWENAVNMYERLTPDAANAFWLISPSLKAQVLSMNIGIGTAGVGFWFQLRDASERGLTLLDLPVVWSQHCSYKGTLGDVVLVNPRGYVVGMRQEIEIDLSPHVYFTTDELALRLILRLDGQSAQSQALTLADGTHTVSDFITLQAR